MKAKRMERPFTFERVERLNDGDYVTSAHYHDLYEIYYITRGTCVYFIDRRSYRLEAGDLVVIPEGVIHNTVYQNLGHERLLINCRRHFIPAAAKPRAYLYRNPFVTGKILSLLEEIEREYEVPDTYSEDAISCLMRLMFYEVSRHPNLYENEAGENETVTRALAYLRENCHRELGLEELAQVTSVSPEYLSRLLKKETGSTFREYRNLIRLQKAQLLLKGAERLDVGEVAARCGFADSNYFSVRFKEAYGLSPRAYRQKHRE